MRFPTTLLLAAAMVAASFGTAGAQNGGQVYAVNLTTAGGPTPDCYRFSGAATDKTGLFSSDLRDIPDAGTENWRKTGAGLSAYVFAGVSDFTVAWGGSGLVLLNFLLFNGQEIDANGLGVGYTVSGIVNATCNKTEDEAPAGIAGVVVADPEPE